MTLEVKKPTKNVEIVTDLQAIETALKLADQAKKISDENTDSMTEAEASKARREFSKAKSEARKALQAVDASTITLTLKGLNFSKFYLILNNNTHEDKNGNDTTDWEKVVTDALPGMFVTAEWKDGHGAISLEDVKSLISSLTDSQMADLIVAVRTLNDPATNIPKELRDLFD